MRESANYDKQQNIADAQQLSQLMRTLYDLCKPSIAKINGQAFGGALGLIACCDIAIATSTAQFAFTEARLGLAPAVISPYILMSIGPRQARRLFLTAERFGSPEAEKMELIHRSVFPDELNSAVEAEIKHLLKAGPESIKACKALIPRLTTEQIEHELVELIATLRTSPEGQEGLNAFFEKRNPAWIKK